METQILRTWTATASTARLTSGATPAIKRQNEIEGEGDCIGMLLSACCSTSTRGVDL